MLSVSSTFSQIFQSSVRDAQYKIGLIETSNFNFPEDVEVSVTSSGDKSTYTKKEYVVNGQPQEPHKYWVAHAPGDNIPDYAKMRTDQGWRVWGTSAQPQPYDHGWWSSAKSNSSGDFTTYPFVEITYSSPYVDANFIRVCTTQVFPGINQFRITVTDSADNTYSSGTLTMPSGKYVYTWALGQVRKIKKIKVEVLSTRWPSDYARITEVSPILEWSPETVPVDEFIRSLKITKSSGSASPGKPHAPGVGSNRISLEFSRDVKGVVTPKENQQLRAYIKFVGATDEVPLGNFIILGEVEENKGGYSCDGFSSLQFVKFYDLPSYVFYRRTTSQIIKQVLGDLGYPDSAIQFYLASDPQWEWYALEGKQGDRILNDLCDHLGVAIYQDEYDKIIVKSSYGNPVMTLTDDLITDLHITRAATVNTVYVHYSILRAEKEDKVWELNEDLNVQAGTTQLLIPLSKRPAVALKPLQRSNLPSGVGVQYVCDGFTLNLTITATRATTIPKGSLWLYGRPVVMSPEKVVVAKDTNSVRLHGIRPHTVELYCGKDSEAQTVANRLLKLLSKADVFQVTLRGRPAPQLQLRDVVTVNSTYFNVNRQLVITEITIDHKGTTLKLIPKEALA